MFKESKTEQVPGNPNKTPDVREMTKVGKTLTHLSRASFLWDIGKQHSPRCDAAERGVPSGAILFAWRNFIEKGANN